QGEEDQSDWQDARLFGEKGQQADAGVLVEPSQLESRVISEDNRTELTSALNQLLAAFDRGGREIAGIPAARAQSFFDCWLQEAEEGFQAADIATCRAGFEQAMTELDANVDRTLVVLLPGSEGSAVTIDIAGQSATLDQPYQAISGDSAGVEPVALSEQSVDRLFSDEVGGEPLPPAEFILTFETGGSVLTPAGQRQLALAIEEIGRRENADVSVVGHTDTVGSAALNVRLARVRAAAVEQLLLAETAEARYLSVDSFGESDPLIPTGNNVDEERNRRVEIVVR
ncbi:MAG: OmpA family protein, partial [Pseudomonadota bacterium]